MSSLLGDNSAEYLNIFYIYTEIHWKLGFSPLIMTQDLRIGRESVKTGPYYDGPAFMS